MQKEKRKRKRVDYEVQVQVSVGETWQKVQSENISIGGILVMMSEPMAVGEKCRVRISADEEERTQWLSADAEVVRVDPLEGEATYKIAMKFSGLDFDSSVKVFNIVRYMTGGDWHTT